MSPAGATPVGAPAVAATHPFTDAHGVQSMAAGRTAMPRHDKPQAAVRHPGQCQDRSVGPSVAPPWAAPEPIWPEGAAWLCDDPSTWAWVAGLGAGPQCDPAPSTGEASPVTSTRASSHAQRRRRANTIRRPYKRALSPVEFRRINPPCCEEAIGSCGERAACHGRKIKQKATVTRHRLGETPLKTGCRSQRWRSIFAPTPDMAAGPTARRYAVLDTSSAKAGLRTAAFAVSITGIKPVAILARNDLYPLALGQEFKKSAKSRGLEVVYFGKYAINALDHASALTEIRGARPDWIIATGYINDLILVRKQMADLGLTAQAITMANGPAYQEFVDALGPLSFAKTGQVNSYVPPVMQVQSGKIVVIYPEPIKQGTLRMGLK